MTKEKLRAIRKKDAKLLKKFKRSVQVCNAKADWYNHYSKNNTGKRYGKSNNNRGNNNGNSGVGINNMETPYSYLAKWRNHKRDKSRQSYNGLTLN